MIQMMSAFAMAEENVIAEFVNAARKNLMDNIVNAMTFLAQEEKMVYYAQVRF